ncbi:MAG: TIGR04283 family arsenosugar biosynthesis glycosyltransferase [Proteobacteria bacterium]|nr:TIGR04283 family arsenosugar biosynthesis glycosyltransferase [Pseudomonadota bacterium]MBU0966493.1 TIGR04283 family arsenosugar biosynthesis glycosyltransferase [Pseudomonadota bacterium]
MKNHCRGSAYLSIIIPALNEAQNITATLRSTETDEYVERVVVDGGSRDDTVVLARNAGARVILSPPGRARQLNRGAAEAQGEVFLFLHGDTRLPRGYARLVRETMAQRHIVAGAFGLAIDSPQKRFKWVAGAANLRSRFLQFPYGDQAIFLRAALFRELGGFPEIPVMEDFHLVQLLRRQGRIHILDQQVVTSARRWRRLGFFRTTLINQLMVLGFLLGFSRNFLAKFYGVVHKS